jgi:23S rRNA pseudouridine1911/1915/1917 synthase
MEQFIAETADKNLRLDHFLTVKVPHLSRSRLQALVKDGHVKVNGEQAISKHKLREGEVVTIEEPEVISSTMVGEDISLEVLFEDDDLIVLNKPAGLVVHPGPGHSGGTLVNALLHHCGGLSAIGGEERPGIVHRLDKETSGCIVAAKNDFTHQSLAAQFADRQVRKVYLALARGHVVRRAGSITAPIGRHRVNRQKMAVDTRGDGREAHTDWKVLAELACGTLVECTLHSGRTHQIRVHLQYLGNPILGDELYGQRGNFTRQMLHAWKLGFAHPRDGRALDFVAPIPEDFRAVGVTI